MRDVPKIQLTHGIFSFDQDVVDCLSFISINVPRDAQLPCVWVDLEEGVFLWFVKAIRQRVEQCTKLRAV